MIYSDHGYLDPIHVVWRKGTDDDPYVDKVEYLKVVNQRVVLSEIPDKFYRVKITGMEEVNIEKITNRKLLENQYSVNYTLGIIQVHESKEAETLNIVYKGRGFIEYPSSRIYHRDKFNDVVLSLENIIDQSIEKIKSLDGKIADYEQIREEILNKLIEVNTAIDEANEATERSEVATDRALDAYETTRLVFKPYVETYSDIIQTYINPEVGWTVQVYDTGIRYRYDGIEWMPIDLFGGNIQPASETVDGLMKKEDYILLHEIDGDVSQLKINVQNLESSVGTIETDLGIIESEIDNLETSIENMKTERVLTFVLPYPSVGVNNVTARFPFNGEIKSVRGICTKAGQDAVTEIDIEKSTDMVSWYTLFDESYLTFNINSHFDNGQHTLLATGVTENDLFRVNVRSISPQVEGVTIEITIDSN